MMHLLEFYVAAEMVVAISDGCERLVATTALVRLLSCVGAHVDYEVAALIERLLAEEASEAGRFRVTEVHLDCILLCLLATVDFLIARRAILKRHRVIRD